MSFLDENEWAQTLLRMINEMERPDYVRAQLDSQPYDLHVQFVESTMSSNPPIKLYSIYTIGRLLTGEINAFFEDPNNDIYLLRILQESSRENIEYINPSTVTYWEALQVKKWPGSLVDLQSAIKTMFSFTPENIDMIVERAILPQILFSDTETGVTAKSEIERDTILYQRLTTMGQQEIQMGKWVSAEKIWNRVAELSARRGWQEQEQYAQTQIATCHQFDAAVHQVTDDYEDKVTIARAYSAKSQWDKAAKIWGSVLELCQKQGWSIQCQEAMDQLEISRRRLQGGMVENFASPIETDAIRTLTSQFKSLIKMEDFAGNAVGFIVKDQHITGLSLRGLKLTTFPSEIGSLTNLEILDLSENQINEIPEWIGNLISLKSLIISKNQLTDLPPSFGELQSLEELYLWANTFTTFPEIITQLQGLKRLDLSKNQIIDIPEGIGNLTALEWFRIAGNAIKNLSIQVKTDLQVLKTNGCDIIGIETLLL